MGRADPVRIPLSGGLFALVSPEDFERVGRFRWSAWKSPRRPGLVYARRTLRIGKSFASEWLHRTIMNAPDGVFVDHRDHDGLNCTRENLRLCDNRENQQNVRSSANQKRGGFKGVIQHKASGSWYAQIRAGGLLPSGKRAHIKAGPFATPLEAAQAYDALAREHFGEWAAPNFASPSDSEREAAS